MYFHQGYSVIDLDYMGNGQRLESFARRWDGNGRIVVEGFASPEGRYAFNQRLSLRRAQAIGQWLRTRLSIADSLVTMQARGIDWEGLVAAIDTIHAMPARDSVLSIIRTTPETVQRGGRPYELRKLRLIYLDGGRPWRYMHDNIFTHLRNSAVRIVIEREDDSDETENVDNIEDVEIVDIIDEIDEIEEVEEIEELVKIEEEAPHQPVSPVIGLYSNLFYDAIAIPNLGIELYLGRRWAVAADWHYAWWKSDKYHRHWRTYGGYLAVRKYLGGRTAEHGDYNGHHLGLYGQILLYDFEWGGKGYLSGAMRHDLWHDPTWAAGVEYGYTLPVARRLSMDFTLGIGYLQGRYHEYRPIDTHYVWQATKNRRWIGPTRLEVNLVWLIGNKKGGVR